MTGPEHYTEAERLAATCLQSPNAEQRSALAAVAQVHATLALTAATVQTIPDSHSGLRNPRAGWNTAMAGQYPELDALRRAVAELLHDADTSADDQAAEVISRFREGLPDTTHGERVLAIAAELMAGESR